MGRWIDRLRHEISAAPPSTPTDKTDRRGVLSVLSVTPEGGAPEITRTTDRRAEGQAGEPAKAANPANWLIGNGAERPSGAANVANRLTVAATGQHEPAGTISQLAALAGSARATDRRDDVLARLLRWQWPRAEAEAVADRIARRDADDDRVTCVECRHYRPGRCAAHKAAGLQSPEVGRDLAALPQRCPAAARKPATGPSAGLYLAGDSGPDH